MKKGLFALAVLIMTIVVLAFSLYAERLQKLWLAHPTMASVERKNGVTVIVDAGHGGTDCGTVGINGILEKDLNLAVADCLHDMLECVGCEVIMTREDDRLVLKEGEDIYGKRKKADLNNRLEIARENPDAVFVSIHMNAFSASQYKGFQVWYAPTSRDAEKLAKSMQNTVAQYLQPDNHRSAKAADSSIFLLENAPGNAILVECGFLSNAEDAENLSKEDYQKRLCFLMLCAMME